MPTIALLFVLRRAGASNHRVLVVVTGTLQRQRGVLNVVGDGFWPVE